jgi:SOS response regulatory protein OraA/RecX
MADPLITRVEPLRPRGLKALLHLDDGADPLEITLEALERSRLGVGDRLSTQRRHHLLNEDADIRVRDAALNLISYRARTRAELRRRLREKGFRPARIDPCLDRLQEKGFLDDEAVAAAFVRDRLRHRPRGRAALSSELRAKGVAGDVAERTIGEVFEEEGTDDVVLARTVGEQWVRRQGAAQLEALASIDRSPERERANRRLVGFLTRRGFRGAALTAGIDRALAAARRDEARGPIRRATAAPERASDEPLTGRSS